jgi:hypothetical protein
MDAIEFQTTVKEIITTIPKDKQKSLAKYHGDKAVRVIILTQPSPKIGLRKDLLRDAEEKGYDDFLDYLIDHPLPVPHPIRFSREELHER